MAKLTPRRRSFVRNYVAGPPGVRGNGRQSAIAAGYAAGSAECEAARLLALPAIRAQVERAADKLDASADRIVAELAAVAFHDVRDFVEWDASGVRLRPSAELDHGAPIAAIEETTGSGPMPSTSVRIKFHDKLEALTTLAKIRGLVSGRGDSSEDAGRPLNIAIIVNGNGNGHALRGPSPDDGIIRVVGGNGNGHANG